MPAPTAYTESHLADFMLDELTSEGKGIAGVLDWTFGTPQVLRAVYATARLMGVSDVATVTEMVTLEVVAQLSIWRAARAALSELYDQTIDTESNKRSQMFDHATLMVEDYTDRCISLGIPGVGGSGTMFVHPLAYSEDPYALPAAAGAEF